MNDHELRVQKALVDALMAAMPSLVSLELEERRRNKRLEASKSFGLISWTHKYRADVAREALSNVE